MLAKLIYECAETQLAWLIATDEVKEVLYVRFDNVDSHGWTSCVEESVLGGRKGSWASDGGDVGSVGAEDA